MSSYTILAICGEDVPTVEGNVAVVRFWIGDAKKEIDVEMPLPQLPPLPPLLQPNAQVYEFFMKSEIEAKMKELEAQNV